jgi:hypothetical protein
MTMLTDKQKAALEYARPFVSGHVYELREMNLSLKVENEQLKADCREYHDELTSIGSSTVELANGNAALKADFETLKQYHERFGEIESKKIVALKSKLDKIRELLNDTNVYGMTELIDKLLSILDEDGEQK